MEWGPSASPDVLKDADPLLNGMAFDIGVLPSRNWTAPVAVPGVTVAVKTRLSPAMDGFEPVVKPRDRLLADVRRSTGLFRTF